MVTMATQAAHGLLLPRISSGGSKAADRGLQSASAITSSRTWPPSATYRSGAARQPSPRISKCHLEVHGPSEAPERGESDATEAGSFSSRHVNTRREALLSGAAALLLAAPQLQLPEALAADVAEELEKKGNSSSRSGRSQPLAVPSELKTDALNAYEFGLPLALPGGLQLNWVESRRPERYSSAAPLAPDARLRIVAERLDYKHSLVCSVYVGPPNAAFLPTLDAGKWDATSVARSVLADKNSTRMTVEQRVQETIFGDAKRVEIDGTPYWYYEYLAQKSPSTFSSGFENYRHSLAVSATREGYLYTLNLSTLNNLWDAAEPALRDAVRSFRLVPPTQDYVPPWKDPWRFW